MFNGVFGFLDYSEGDIFFHKSAICDNSDVKIGDRVSFIIAPSSKKNGKSQAENISVVESISMPEKKDIQPLKTVFSCRIPATGRDPAAEIMKMK